ncbi:hypothetical protein WN944_018939 [Citrus x changshan-huyou]|uniref:Uncharacterized protein n=1 Tax=Citrus x changshan-huyou TaxID=2935761 RepID=A0AAP0LX82_9ROSI
MESLTEGIVDRTSGRHRRLESLDTLKPLILVLDQLIEEEQVLDDTTSSLLIDRFNYAMPPSLPQAHFLVLNSGAGTTSSKAMGIVELESDDMALTDDMASTDDMAPTNDVAAFDWTNDVALAAYVALTDELALTDDIRALVSSIKFAQQVFGTVVEEGNFRVYPERRRAVFRSMRAIKWATFKVSTSWVREIAPMPIRFGGIIAACARMTNDNKWRRANNFKNLTHSTIEQQNRTIDELQNEMRVDFNSQAQSISNLEKMVGQLASSVQTLAMTVEKDKFPSQPVPNPKGVHEASISSPQQHGERLAKGKKGKSTGEIFEIFKQSVFMKLRLGELHPTPVVLQLADRSTKIPRSIVEDVLIQVDKFYFPVDFIVIDTQPIQDLRKHIPIIIGRLFLATADTPIQCRIGNM